MECLAEGSGQCSSMAGEGTTSKNGGEAPAFQLTETVFPGGHNLVDLKSGYSDSLCPDKEEWDSRGEQETRFSCLTR